MKVAWLALFAAGCAQSGPHLISATPPSGAYLAMVTIAGEGMCAGDCAKAGGEFVFSLGPPGQDVRLVVEDLFDTRADIMIPNSAGIGKGTITLTVNDTSSNALPFEVTP